MTGECPWAEVSADAKAGLQSLLRAVRTDVDAATMLFFRKCRSLTRRLDLRTGVAHDHVIVDRCDPYHGHSDPRSRAL